MKSSLLATLMQQQTSIGLEAEMLLLAADDPDFSTFIPDDFKAYFRFRICTAFPKVIGPELHGRYFGFHPQVLVNSYRSLLHQQTNIGHLLASAGARRDRIIGTVVGVRVGNIQRGHAQKIAASIEEAQFLDVVAVVHKRAEGVKELLGRHVSAKQKTSVSIEMSPRIAEMGVYDPQGQIIVPIKTALETWPDLIKAHKTKGLQIGAVDGVQFAFAPGMEAGAVTFSGVGYVPNPAEGATARVLDLAAADGGVEGEMALAAIAIEDWESGQPVCWQQLLAGDAGRGVIVDVITAGTVFKGGLAKIATPADPLLEIAVTGKKLKVIRSASSVKKIDK